MEYQEAHAHSALPMSTVSLFTNSFRETTGLLRGEIRLVRTKIGSKVSRISSGNVILAIGYLLATVGTLIVLWSAVFALELVWTDWSAALLVGGPIFIIWLSFMGGEISKLTPRKLAPQDSM